MATSFHPWNSSNGSQGGGDDRENRTLEERETKPETVTKRGRKSKNGPPQKKTPQRGLGVAQLERLRLQERWKKMTEMDPLLCHNLQDQVHFPFSFPLVNHQTGIAVPLSGLAPANYAAVSSQSNGQSTSQSLIHKPHSIANSGFSGVPAVSVGGLRLPTYYSDQFQADRSRIDGQKVRFQNGHPLETGKELSSIQTQRMHGLSDQSAMWDKKRFNGENLGHGEGPGRYSWAMPTNGNDFLALNLGWNRDLGFGMGARHSGSNVVHEEVEVVAIHRKGKSVAGDVIMEYDFFPCVAMDRNNGGSSSTSQTEASSSSEASAVVTATAGAVGEASRSAANFLDLSLKLSC
ncbi:PREDICTED: uncharacterized protein LOC104605726 [Nelumbo nucifera]|uniref:Uncharacterized protein LOC104605726 n=1 Tax=Nelumbo nucifera TaxID=4432 RepID=A0A1U8AZG7_NELNU|nr:PREDICTED: uncharacterized protein LOC104605726 [Nelumbo nucifera]